VRQAEAPPDDARVAEQALHVFRPRAGRDVEIFGGTPEQKVPHATAYEVRLVTVANEPTHDFRGVRIELARIQVASVTTRPAGNVALDGANQIFVLQES
jgi:hypothetical protein